VASVGLKSCPIKAFCVVELKKSRSFFPQVYVCNYCAGLSLLSVHLKDNFANDLRRKVNYSMNTNDKSGFKCTFNKN
jgi:hypothetical protein